MMFSKIEMIPAAILFTHDGISTAGKYAQTKSTNQPYQFVQHDGQMLPVQGGNNTYPHTYALSYDPLEDYLAWHGIASNERHSRQTSIHVSEIEGRRVWARKEFNDWFVTECQNTVYVQRVTDVAWTLTFVDINDYYNFNKWWLTPRSSYRFSVKPHDRLSPEGIQAWQQLRTEFIDWCKETLRDRHSLNVYSDAAKIEFENDNEALMFKLTWADKLRIDIST